MAKIMAMIRGAILGAGFMYLFDPDRGRRRRALIRDQIVSLLNDLDDVVETTAHDLSNRAHGLLSETRSLVTGETRSSSGPRTFELMQENWSPTARLLTGLGGGALFLRGTLRGGLIGTLMSMVGLSLAMRGLTNLELRRLFGLGSGRRGIDVQKAINVSAPVEQVYQFWSNFENFPRFMSHLHEVRDLGNSRSRWVAAGPADVPIEWQAMVTEQVENERIAWQSVEGELVASAGVVQFHPYEDGGTLVTVRMTYNPPAGALGHAVAALFGVDPKRAMDEDLMRFKSLLEEGKTTSRGKKVKQERLGQGDQPASPTSG